MKTNTDRILKVVSIIGFMLITSALILIKNNPTTGYELSIYAAVPSFAWVFLIGSIVCGISIITQQALTRECERRSWWLIGLLLIMFSNLTILLLPVLRGYVLYGRWDVLTHVGYVLDILQSGFIHPDNIYPVTHIFISNISYLLNKPATVIAGYLAPLFILLSVLYTYLLATVIFNEQQKIVFATTLSTVLFLSYTSYQVFPTAFSIFMIPLVLYLYFKNSENPSPEFKTLFVLLIILFPFFHPLTSLVLIFAFISMELFRFGFDRILKNNPSDANLELTGKISLNPVLILCITFIMWLSSHYYFWNNNLRTVISWFKGEATTEVLSKDILNVFERLNLQLIDIMELYLKMYGHISIFLIFSFVATIIIVKRVLFSSDKSTKNIFVLLAWLVLNSLFLSINLVNTVLQFGVWRLIGLTVVVLPIFVGFALSELFCKPSSKNKKKFLNLSFVIFVLLTSSMIGIFSTYPSPWTLQTNQQVTQMEMTGVAWHYEHKNQTIVDYGVRSTGRFADVLLGFGVRKERNVLCVERADTLCRFKLPRGLVPDHFNYVNCSRLGDSLIENAYLPIPKYDKVFYTEMYPELDTFTTSDFQSLTNDPTVYRLYSNGELEVFFVNTTRSP